MIIIYQHAEQLTKERKEKYAKANCRVMSLAQYYYLNKVNQHSVVSIGESVGLLLDLQEEHYKAMINIMTRLLCRNKYHTKAKTKVTLNYKGENYVLTNISDWTSGPDKAGNYHKHEILLDVESKKLEEREALKQEREEKPIKMLLAYMDDKIPEDLDDIIEKYARLYDIQIRYSTEFELEDKLRAYQSINYYMEHDIEYCNDILGYEPDEEKMFETISFGNETYLEDYVYQNA